MHEFPSKNCHRDVTAMVQAPVCRKSRVRKMFCTSVEDETCDHVPGRSEIQATRPGIFRPNSRPSTRSVCRRIDAQQPYGREVSREASTVGRGFLPHEW